MIKIYTDGSCLGNPGKGGWAAIILNEGKKTEIKGSEKDTTNNQMELLAPIKALKKIPKGSKVEIFTDSKYVKSGITEWIKNWKKNGWKTSTGKSVQNLDLWQKIDQLRINGLEMEYVKGHSGDKSNDRVDLIATNYSKGISIDCELKKSKVSKEFVAEVAPSEIQELYSRNELMQKFAEKQYYLSSLELKKLLGEESYLFIEKYLLFEWRNWKLIPKNKKYWIIEKKVS